MSLCNALIKKIKIFFLTLVLLIHYSFTQGFENESSKKKIVHFVYARIVIYPYLSSYLKYFQMKRYKFRTLTYLKQIKN